MNDDEVIAAAYADGFRLEERIASHPGAWAWGWVRGDDDRWPCFLERRQAIAGGGNDVMSPHMQNFDPNATNIELKAVPAEEFERTQFLFGVNPQPVHTEPLVPFSLMQEDVFRSGEASDVICLAQSPPFTPRSADLVFEHIRRRYIDETPFLSSGSLASRLRGEVHEHTFGALCGCLRPCEQVAGTGGPGGF